MTIDIIGFFAQFTGRKFPVITERFKILIFSLHVTSSIENHVLATQPLFSYVLHK